MKNHLLRIKPGVSLFACAACALGLLLWARLLLVSHPPRVATAEPLPKPVSNEKRPVEGAKDPNGNGNDNNHGDRSDAAKD